MLNSSDFVYYDAPLYKSTGMLKYTDDYKLVVKIDQGISDYYRSLIPKYILVAKPRWPAHITVVRSGKETPINLEHWGKYDGESVQFLYSPNILSGKIYFWLNCFCSKIEDIRLELGLPVVEQITNPPDGFRKCFHCTIGNMKEV